MKISLDFLLKTIYYHLINQVLRKVFYVYTSCHLLTDLKLEVS